jgi:hypothetical protein|uniref:Nucleotidyltransferase family protein n=1 Tax=Bellilinea caldifistulae TaxID=360411 RepID=A0A7C4Q2B5_9CHLR
MLPREFETALQTILEQLTGLPEAWALTGSVGMVLQGMPLQVHDIDVQTSPLGAIQIQQRLEGWMVEPVRQVESSFMRSLLGRAVVEGVEVEIIGGVQKRLEGGGWEEPVNVAEHRRRVEWRGLNVPVLVLEYEAEAYRRMGRLEKAEKIRRWLDSTKPLD